LPIVLVWCETRFLTLREEHTLRVFENRVLRITGQRRDEVTCIIIMIKSRRMRWAGNVTRMGKKRNAYRLLDGKLQGRRPLGIPIRRWVDYIKLDLGEMGWGGVD
jgi:hypothetical protein